MRLFPLVLAALLVLVAGSAQAAVATGEALPQDEPPADLLVLLLRPLEETGDVGLGPATQGEHGASRASKGRRAQLPWILLVLEVDAGGGGLGFSETRVAGSDFSGGFPTGADPPESRIPSPASAHGYDQVRPGAVSQGLRREGIGDNFRRYELYAAMHRHARPNLGRWLKRDPGLFIDGQNRYQWLGNSPMFFADPDGFQRRVAPLGRREARRLRNYARRRNIPSSVSQNGGLDGVYLGFGGGFRHFLPQPPPLNSPGLSQAQRARINLAFARAGLRPRRLFTPQETQVLQRALEACVRRPEIQRFRVTAGRVRHILEGDPPGTGHGPRRVRDESSFPDTWSDAQVIRAIERIVNSPASTWRQSTGPGLRTAPVTRGRPDPGAPRFNRSGRPVRFRVRGRDHGLTIEVIVEPRGEGVITGYVTGYLRDARISATR